MTEVANKNGNAKQQYCFYHVVSVEKHFDFKCYCECLSEQGEEPFCVFYKKHLSTFKPGKDPLIIKPKWCENTGMIIDWVGTLKRRSNEQ